VTSEDIDADTRRFLRGKGNRVNKIPIGVSGLVEPVRLTQKQVRERSKRHFRKGQIAQCNGDTKA
jgi:hypothetical protein